MFDKILNIVWGIANAVALDIETLNEEDGTSIKEVMEKMDRRMLKSVGNGMFVDEQFVGKEIASHMATCNYYLGYAVFYTVMTTMIVTTATTLAIIDEL